MKNHSRKVPKIKMAIWGIAIILFSACSPQLHKSSSFELLSIDPLTTIDKDFEEIIAPYKVRLDAEMNKVIARSEKELTKGGKGETALGNLVADLQKEFSQEKFNLPVDISVVNNGGLRNSLPKGDITVGNIFELAPFENFIYILELNAEDVKRLGEYAVKGKNLGLTGLHLEAKENNLNILTVNGEALDHSRKYLVAINDYLANGGDRMDFLVDLPRVKSSNILMREMLLDKIKALTTEGKKVDAAIEGRQIYK
ncbi:5'-nucleotidase C-terminal domain-containing protein [Anditalea andensis]|uniref:5'-nucleotidase n=1 Tax=Anditalea andensis TaxID=1048983 RepID=A0A074LLQ8_9BACT|nr:5'-nucleotidase [Anditalea andensis]KEO74802.1 5'-nucleotidase [Anditalea andensis]